MRNRLMGSIAVLTLAVIVFSWIPFARAGQGARGGRGNAAAEPPSPPHDPHDLSGLWLGQGGGGRGNANSGADPKGFLKDGGIQTQWGPSSPLTPEGLKAVNANLSGKGPRAVPPVYSNDLLGDANPPGLVRALLRLTERWRRLDRDHLELVLNINDPGTYTKPWTTNPRVFRLQPKGSAGGEMLEVIFAPVDERDFNQKIRDPAGKK